MGDNLQSCPILKTHNRLLESHRLWHQTASYYHDPDGFKTNLNALIQALRNITFILQSEKSKIPNFDNWYKIWQDKLRDDKILSWLHNARTKIVHQTDLEIKSRAIATIQTYIDIAQIQIEIPPFLTDKNIISFLIKSIQNKIPDYIINKAIVTIERKWIDINLEDYELLDALAHSFGVLKDLVSEAHQISGCVQCSIFDPIHLNYLLDVKGKLPCMVDFDRLRFKTFSIFESRQMNINADIIPDIEKSFEKASRRYKLKGGVPKNMFSSDVVEMAEAMVKFSKKILKKDKHHALTVFLKLPDNKCEIYRLLPNVQSDKYALWRYLAEEVDKTKADALICIGEVWLGSIEKFINNGLEAHEQCGKKEALEVSLFTSSGLKKSYITPFSRSITGRIMFEETKVLEDVEYNYILPVLKIWGIK